MKVAVTDACIFIDLIELDLVSSFFKLDIQLHTTVDVVNELFPEQKQILQAYESGQLLTWRERILWRWLKSLFLKGFLRKIRL